MKVIFVATAMIVAMIGTTNSLPLASSSPEEAQPVIPLEEKQPALPQEVPASDIPVAKSELKPEVSVPAEPIPEVKESEPAVPETRAIEEKAIIVPSIDEKKEIVDVVAVENSGVKEEETVLNIARSAEPEAAPKVDEATPVTMSVIEGKKLLAPTESAKGITLPNPEALATEEAVKPEEQEPGAGIVGKDLPTESRSETVENEKEIAAEIPAEKIKEKDIISEPYESSKQVVAEEKSEAVAKIAVKSEELPAEGIPLIAEVPEPVQSQGEERSAGSEPEVEAKEAKEAVKEETKLKEDEEPLKKEEGKKVELEEAKKEEALEESKKPINAEKLPVAEELKEPAKKPEDLKESSEESSEEEERSPEKDKNAVNKNEEDSSQEESEEKKSS